MVSNIFYVHPDPWGNDPIWLAVFKWVETINFRHSIMFISVTSFPFIVGEKGIWKHEVGWRKLAQQGTQVILRLLCLNYSKLTNPSSPEVLQLYKWIEQKTTCGVLIIVTFVLNRGLAYLAYPPWNQQFAHENPHLSWYIPSKMDGFSMAQAFCVGRVEATLKKRLGSNQKAATDGWWIRSRVLMVVVFMLKIM